jgi:hypothetical protein
MDACRYVLVRLVPDAVRNEAINVGVLVQTRSRIEGRFIDGLPTSRVPDSYMREYAGQLQEQWRRRLSGDCEMVLLPGWDRPKPVRLVDEDFLRWLHLGSDPFLRFTEPRAVETSNLDDVQFENIVSELFESLVARRVPKREITVATRPPLRNRRYVKHHVGEALSKYGLAEQFEAPAEVDGKIVSRWTFDWARVREASGILIDTVWLGHPELDRNIREAAYVSAKARDVHEAGQYEIHAMVYSPDGSRDASMQEAKQLLRSEEVRLSDFFRVEEAAEALARRLGTYPPRLR